MANPLNDFLTARSDKKPFSMADYEAIPVENRQAYVANTSADYPPKAKEPVLNVEGSMPQVVAAAPVSPKVEQIKAIFSPQAAVPEQPAAYTPPVAASNLIDMSKVQGQAAGMMPERGFADWLPALAPLAVEALMGKGHGGGVSYGIAGKGVLDSEKDRVGRQRGLEDKLMEIEKARAIAAAKGLKGAAGKLYEVTGPNGEPIFLTREQAIEKQAWKDTKKGSDRGEIAALGRAQTLKLKDREAITNVRDKLIGNKNFQAARARFYATNDAVDVLNQRNAVGDAGVQILFAKGIFGEVGNLTAQEQAKFIGSPELTTAFHRMMTKYKEGTLDEKDRSMLLKLATHMRERSKKVAGEVASGYTEGLKSLGIDSSGVVAPLLGGSEVSPQYAAEVNSAPPASYNRAMSPEQNKYNMIPPTPSASSFPSFEDWKKSQKGTK